MSPQISTHKKILNPEKLIAELQKKAAYYSEKSNEHKDNVHSYTMYTSIFISLQETATCIAKSLE